MSDNITDWNSAPEDDAFVNEQENEEFGELAVTTDHANDEVATLIQHDSTGQEVTTEINFSSPPLTKEQAVEITARIKTTTNLLYMLIKRAHAGKAYEALGYRTFKDYIAGEFQFSTVYAYRLLNQANFIEAIEAKVPTGTEVRISEPVSKELKHVLPELLEEIEDKTTGLEADDAGAVIEDIIRERREREREAAEEDDEDDAFGEDDAPFQGNGNGGPYQGDYEEEIDFEDDEEEDPLLTEDSADVRRKFDKLYNLYTGLKNINTVGDGDELIDFLPVERWEEFDGLFENVLPWLTDFYEKFKTYRSEKEQSESLDAGEVDEDEIDFSDSDF